MFIAYPLTNFYKSDTFQSPQFCGQFSIKIKFPKEEPVKITNILILVLTVALVVACGKDDGKDKIKTVVDNSTSDVTEATGRLTIDLADQELWTKGATMGFHLRCTEKETHTVTPDDVYEGFPTAPTYVLFPSVCEIDKASINVSGETYNLVEPLSFGFDAGHDFTIYMVVSGGGLILGTDLVLLSADADGDCITGNADTDPTNRLIPNPNPPASCQ